MKQEHLNICCPHCKKYTTLFTEEVESGVITQRVTFTGLNPNSFEFELKTKVTDIEFYNPTRSRITTATCKRCGKRVDLQPIRQSLIEADIDKRTAERREVERLSVIKPGDIVTLPELEEYLGDVGIINCD